MTTQTIDAIFHNGTFHPVRPIVNEISEGQTVRLIVQKAELPKVLELAGAVYDDLSPDEVSQVEKIALDRREFFERDNQ